MIVSLNRRKQVHRSLEALGSAHQIIVVDNGSNDGTLDLEPLFPNARFVRLPRNFGHTKALNLGVRAAEAELVLLLHDDVCITADDVSRLADILESRWPAAAADRARPASAELSPVDLVYRLQSGEVDKSRLRRSGIPEYPQGGRRRRR